MLQTCHYILFFLPQFRPPLASKDVETRLSRLTALMLQLLLGGCTSTSPVPEPIPVAKIGTTPVAVAAASSGAAKPALATPVNLPRQELTPGTGLSPSEPTSDIRARKEPPQGVRQFDSTSTSSAAKVSTRTIRQDEPVKVPWWKRFYNPFTPALPMSGEILSPGVGEVPSGRETVLVVTFIERNNGDQDLIRAQRDMEEIRGDLTTSLLEKGYRPVERGVHERTLQALETRRETIDSKLSEIGRHSEAKLVLVARVELSTSGRLQSPGIKMNFGRSFAMRLDRATVILRLIDTTTGAVVWTNRQTVEQLADDSKPASLPKDLVRRLGTTLPRKP